MDKFNIIDVTPANVMQETLFCVKDTKSPGFACKKGWFINRFEEGLRLKILKDTTGKPLAFIEYLPGSQAWRPVLAEGFMFIHCMFVYANNDKRKGLGSLLLNACEQDAKERNMSGIAVMTSHGSWITDKRLFEKNGYVETAKRGRFELMVKKLDPDVPDPLLLDWTAQQSKYTGWNLIYADQCPWHEKSVCALKETAKEYGIELKITKLQTAREAQKAPSGFGVFSLIRDGRLLEDHYISQTRYRNILQKELARK